MLSSGSLKIAFQLPEEFIELLRNYFLRIVFILKNNPFENGTPFLADFSILHNAKRSIV